MLNQLSSLNLCCPEAKYDWGLVEPIRMGGVDKEILFFQWEFFCFVYHYNVQLNENTLKIKKQVGLRNVME